MNDKALRRRRIYYKGKGHYLDEFLIMPCREQSGKTFLGSVYDIEWLDDYRDAEFWAVYSVQGCIKTWLKDCPSYREAAAFVNRWKEVEGHRRWEKEEQDRIYDFIQKIDLSEAL